VELPNETYRLICNNFMQRECSVSTHTNPSELPCVNRVTPCVYLFLFPFYVVPSPVLLSLLHAVCCVLSASNNEHDDDNNESGEKKA